MKKIINNPENVVQEMLDGMVAAYPQYVRKIDGFEVIVRANAPIKVRSHWYPAEAAVMNLPCRLCRKGM